MAPCLRLIASIRRLSTELAVAFATFGMLEVHAWLFSFFVRQILWRADSFSTLA